jgi:hypothetical protein
MIGLDPADIINQVERRSQLIRIIDPGLGSGAGAPAAQPRLLRWKDVVLTLRLNKATDPGVSQDLYQAGLQLLLDEGEVAMIALPDLLRDLPLDLATTIQYAALVGVDALHDRMVLLDLPFPDLDSIRARPGRTRYAMRTCAMVRSAGAYHPWLSVQTPWRNGKSAAFHSV